MMGEYRLRLICFPIISKGLRPLPPIPEKSILLRFVTSAVVLQLAFFFHLLLSLSCLLLLVVARFVLIPFAPTFGTSKNRFEICQLLPQNEQPSRQKIFCTLWIRHAAGAGSYLGNLLGHLGKSNPSEG